MKDWGWSVNTSRKARSLQAFELIKMTNQGVYLGRTLIAREGIPAVNSKDRFRHLYMVGKTQTGKSTFFLNLIQQELDSGAIIVLDPAGTFAQAVASFAPKERLVYVDKNHPLIINPLDRPLSKSDIVNDFIEVVNNCVTGSTPSIEITVLMTEIIRNAVRVMPDNKRSIEYLAEFLNYEHIRKQYANDEYWKHFDDRDNRGWYIYREKRESAQRVASRLSAFYLDESLRRFTIGRNELDIKKIAEEKKIVCFDFKGLNNDLMIYLGNLITTAVKSYYMHCQTTTENPPLFLYVDEFHLFVSPAFDNMLAECAKFNISVNLCHHSFEQVKKETLDIALGNCYTKVAFNCGYTEAERMAKEFQKKPEDFLNLKRYETHALVGNEPHHILTFPPPKTEDYAPEKTVNFLRDDWIMV